MAQDPSPSDLSAIDARLDAGEIRMDKLTAELAENTAATKRIEANTAGMLEFFQAAQGAFKVLHWIGKAARPVGYIAAAGAGIVGFWSALKGGGIGPK